MHKEESLTCCLNLPLSLSWISITPMGSSGPYAMPHSTWIIWENLSCCSLLSYQQQWVFSTYSCSDSTISASSSAKFVHLWVDLFLLVTMQTYAHGMSSGIQCNMPTAWLYQCSFFVPRIFCSQILSSFNSLHLWSPLQPSGKLYSICFFGDGNCFQAENNLKMSPPPCRYHQLYQASWGKHSQEFSA